MNPQYDATGRLRHLLTLEDMPIALLDDLLDRAGALLEAARGGRSCRERLAGKTLCTLFFETSTRTRSSFQLAGVRMGMDVLGFDVSTSSTSKGESAIDTLRTLEAMGVDAFAVRHSDDAAVAELASAAAPGTVLINAGAGRAAHPTQGLLDMLTLRRHKGRDFSRLNVLIVGDIKHSRVARSDLHALRALGTGSIRACGPAALLPEDGTLAGVEVMQDFDAALDGVDVVMMLRLQRERMVEGLVPSLEGYFQDYGLTPQRLARARPDAIVLHPGPMNRGVEIDSAVADGPQSCILEQVGNGVAVRMAVLEALLGS
ncbi:MAG TPA: aspartate carbamoyltransferase catalytic subunit [Arenimonas sp.]|nr:aspartate carbamoyltransferase catalytic subunit [Arenimonas sp.]